MRGVFPRVDYLNWAGVRMVLCPLHYTVHCTVHSVPCSGLGYTHGLLSSGQSKLRPRTVFSASVNLGLGTPGDTFE